VIKVLLVDDEEMIRQGIADSIDWEKLNMKVIGHAEDGEDALIIFNEHTPQLILTDIKMPFMDGLELVEKVKSQNPDTYIIIISGYDEFHYAQKAIKLGAHDFILKPIDLDDLEKMLSKISQDYDSKLHKENEEKVLKEKVDNSLHILQASFLKDLLFSNVDPDSIAEKVKELQIKEASYGNVLLFKVDENENTKNVLSNLSGDEEDLFVLK
jgi:two-component system, response regulator YesN